MIKRLFQWLRARLAYLNILLALAAYIANEYFVQGFCQPVPWAGWVLLLGTGAFLAWPWLHRTLPVVQYAALFLQGIGFTVCVYCQWFVERGALVALVAFFLLFPLLFLVPTFFAVQLLKRGVLNALPMGRLAFGLGVAALLPAQLWVEWQYRAVEAAVARLPAGQQQDLAALDQVISRTYVAERLAGAFFKYHNYLEFIYDGWRPPLHDPLVNVSLWLRPVGGARPSNPLDMRNVDKQVALYQRLFPGLPVKADCICTQTRDGRTYLYWQPPGIPQ